MYPATNDQVWGPGRMQKNPIYVAETNAAGQVECVWYDGPDSEIPRPVRSAAQHLDLFPAAQFSGASEKAIYDWIRKQADVPGR